MRDLGGLPTEGGDVVRHRRLLRSDNLQDLAERSITTLLEDYHLTDVVDLRTHVEVAKEGDGPLRATAVRHHHFTLYREDSVESGIPAAERALPWERTEKERTETERAARRGEREERRPSHDEFWSEHYLSYLSTRPDSVVAALHAIAGSEGAAIVHCAAGKDRTGTIIGLALKIVGVPDDEWGQRVAVCVVLHDAADLTLDALRDWTKQRLAPYKAPSLMKVVDALPRNVMGKVQKPAIAEMFNQRDWSALRNNVRRCVPV